MDGRLIVKSGDITKEKADAIVNAANSTLLGGGGVDGAIHSAGGPSILEECRAIRKKVYPNGLPAGEAVATSAGELPARFVIHTVGPVWHGGNQNEPEILANAYQNSLRAAEEKGCATIAFPAISTGVYGFPRELAAKIVSRVLMEYFLSDGKISTVTLVFYGKSDYEIFLAHSDLE
ncbi:MAG: O-acetyl-ADP-ribose deacetylase [Spirochaetes bacterium GWF1_51_8]|nr:MAG: O-acetyl-ADP-ribose deacetylase [Spirochaetes bacterium GWF1_51_8]